MPQPRRSSLLAVAVAATCLTTPALAGETLTASPAASGDALGLAVALDGERALVGAPQQPGGTPQGPGFAIVFRDTGSGWIEEDRLEVSGGSQGDGVGLAVALDGDTAVIGAPWAGAAHVFVRSGTSWSLQQTLTPSAPVSFDSFGDGVALDGDRLAVGRPGKGTVEVYERSGSSWSQAGTAEPLTGADFGAEFGESVVLDGDRLFVGAPGFDSLGYDSGGVYSFELVGGSWQQVDLAEASDGATVTGIGTSIALVDGQIVAGSQNNTVYVWDVDDGALVHEQRLYTSDPDNAGPQWGLVVAADGDWLAVGDTGDDALGQGAGAVTIFRRAGDAWYAQDVVRSGSADTFDSFGQAVAVQGARLLAGAPGEDDAANNGGAAELFELFPGAPWIDLGQGLAGSGLPALTPGGSLTSGAATTLDISGGPAFGTAALVIGVSELDASFKGGVMVPDTDLLLLGLPLDAHGALVLDFDWFLGLPGDLSVWFQVWINDVEGPLGFSSTNGVQGVTP